MTLRQCVCLLVCTTAAFASRPAFIAAKLPTSNADEARAADDAEKSSSAHIKGPPIVPTRDYVPAALQNFRGPQTHAAARSQTSAYLNHYEQSQYGQSDPRENLRDYPDPLGNRFTTNEDHSNYGLTPQSNSYGITPQMRQYGQETVATGYQSPSNTHLHIDQQNRENTGRSPALGATEGSVNSIVTPSYSKLRSPFEVEYERAHVSDNWQRREHPTAGYSSPLQTSPYHQAGPPLGSSYLDNFLGRQAPLASSWGWGQRRRLSAEDEGDEIQKILEDMILHGEDRFRIV